MGLEDTFTNLGSGTLTFMEQFGQEILKNLYRVPKDSHKGQNGRLLVIGGSKLFHASAFWAADVASRVVDLVHFTSPANENNELVRKKLKEGFWQGIVTPWEKVGEYINEDDCVLIGPGMPRESGEQSGDVDTGDITNGLLKQHGGKKWVIDGGALQEMDVGLVPRNAILTPHRREFEGLFKKSKAPADFLSAGIEDRVKWFSKTYHCVVLLKGREDVVCAGGDCDEKICKPGECKKIVGGNPGMTKGGTGDVLAGLTAALYCKNDAFLSAAAASFINKKAGDSLYKTVGPNFNASDLVKEVPRVMKEVVVY